MTLVNTMLISIVTTADPAGDAGLGGFWQLVIPVAMVLAVGTLGLRGSVRAGGRKPGAVDDLRRGWRLGMVCPGLIVAGILAWPSVLGVKVAFGLIGTLLAVAAVWGCGGALGSVAEIADEMRR